MLSLLSRKSGNSCKPWEREREGGGGGVLCLTNMWKLTTQLSVWLCSCFFSWRTCMLFSLHLHNVMLIRGLITQLALPPSSSFCLSLSESLSLSLSLSPSLFLSLCLCLSIYLPIYIYSFLFQSPTRFRHDSMRWGSHTIFARWWQSQRNQCLCNQSSDLVAAMNMSDRIFDHCMVTTQLREPCTQRKYKRNESSTSDGSFPWKIVPDFRNVDWHGPRVHLLTSPLLEAIQGTHHVNCAAAVWESMFVEILQRHIPTRYIRHGPKSKVWMTSKLRRLSKTKFWLFKKLEEADSSRLDGGPHTANTEFHAAKSAYIRSKY